MLHPWWIQEPGLGPERLSSCAGPGRPPRRPLACGSLRGPTPCGGRRLSHPEELGDQCLVGRRLGKAQIPQDPSTLLLLRAPSGTTMMLYHYFRKFDGNVCMDWRLTSDLSTSLQTTDGKTARVNSQAFQQFLNPNFKGSEAGSCQEAGPRLIVLLRPRLAFRCTVSPLCLLSRSLASLALTGFERSRVRGQAVEVFCVRKASSCSCLPRAADLIGKQLPPSCSRSIPTSKALRLVHARKQVRGSSRSAASRGGSRRPFP